MTEDKKKLFPQIRVDVSLVNEDGQVTSQETSQTGYLPDGNLAAIAVNLFNKVAENIFRETPYPSYWHEAGAFSGMTLRPMWIDSEDAHDRGRPPKIE